MKRKILFFIHIPLAFFVLCRFFFLHICFGTKVCKIRTNRIGHLFGNVDMYLCLKSLGKIENNRLIFVGDESVCNKTALDMVKQSVETYQKGYSYFVAYEILRRLKLNKFIYLLPSDQDVNGVLTVTPRNFSIPDYVEKETSEYLQSLSKRSFFTTMVRDQAYLFSKFGEGFDYHDYRNSDPKTHFAATDRFAKRHSLLGIRMGSVVNYELPPDLKNMIDYANQKRNSALDIGLINECLFFSHCGAGFSSVPRALRKPMINVNQVALNYSGGNLLLFIPKKLWLKEERRFLSYFEIINSEIGYIVDSRRYVELGIELVENTEEEIFDAHEEAYLRLTDNYDEDVEMRQLNAEIASQYPKDAITPTRKAPIGQKFLRENLYLFQR